MLGYYAVFYVQQKIIKQEIVQVIEKEALSDKDLIVFSIPITLPYQSDRDYERVEGDFEYEGRYYEMVKKRLKNDTLYVYCINNLAQERLKANLSKHTAAHISSLAGSENRSTTEKIIKQAIKDYFSKASEMLAAKPHYVAFIEATSYYLPHITSFDLRVPSPPPKLS